MKLYHCPGHGFGNSPKGIEHAGLVESDWVVTMAQDLSAALWNWGLEQKIGRQGSESPTYQERAEEAAEWGADIVLCHHANGIFHDDGSPNPGVDGLMTFHLPGDWMAREIAAAIMRAAPAGLLRKKPTPYAASQGDWTRRARHVLQHYRPAHAVLIEWGFATSPGDLAILTSQASRPALCAAGCVGVSRALELAHPGL